MQPVRALDERYRPGEIVIDLGDDWAVPDTASPATRDWHRLLLAVGLVLALALGGSAHPGPRLTRVGALPGVGSNTFVLTEDAINVVEVSTARESRVASYGIADGRPRWTTTLPSLVTGLVVEPHAGVLLAVTQPTTGIDEWQGAVGALDPATGHRLWWQDNTELVSVRPDLGTAVLVRDRVPEASAVFAVDLRTGVTRWSWPVDSPDAQWVLVTGSPLAAGAPARTVLMVDDLLTVLDSATGRVVASHRVGIPSADDRNDARSPRLYVIGQRVIVAYEDRFHTVLASFTLAGLQPRWRSTMPTETSFLAGCGPVLCAGTGILATCKPVRCSAIDSVLYGLDPNSAEVRWTSTTWSWAGPVIDAGPTNGGPGRDGRLLVYNREPPGSLAEADAVIDAGTGQLLLSLNSWLPVPAAPSSDTVLVSARSGATDSWFAVLLSGAAPALLPLGRLPVAGQECQSTARYLVCPTLGRQLVTWRY